jgi:hypothetical protein
VKQEVRCACGHFFQVDEGAAGGYVNCPRCEKAVEVPGLRDPLWRLFQVSAVVVWGGAIYFAGATWGAPAAILVGLALALLLWLVSRAF